MVPAALQEAEEAGVFPGKVTDSVSDVILRLTFFDHGRFKMMSRSPRQSILKATALASKAEQPNWPKRD